MQQWQKYAAEILGTFILVFGGCVAVVAGGDASSFWAPFGFGLALLAGLYAFGEVSGGHFNPIVSLAMFIDRRLKLDDMIGYWLSQFLGAILATLVMKIAFSQSSIAGTATVPTGGDGRALLVEIVFTAIFVAVILQVTRSGKFGSSALIAIPLTLMMIHFATVPISGTSVNPARTIASSLVGNRWDSTWIYFVGPIVGAILGWIAFAVAQKGDTNPMDDLRTAAGEMQAKAQASMPGSSSGSTGSGSSTSS
jgi:aquaporin Z